VARLGWNSLKTVPLQRLTLLFDCFLFENCCWAA
jgi:hypothetical protein